MECRPRVGMPIQIGRNIHVPVYSKEHNEYHRMRGKIPWNELLPYIKACNDKERLYTQWQQHWDEPVM